MKNILYFMHVPWGWIKQRPHFLAEELSKKFNVEIAEQQILKPGANKGLPTKKSCVEVKSFFAIPLYNPFVKRNKVFDFFNELILKLRFRFNKYDYIWITSILYYYKIKNLIPRNSILIYDCMDDEFAFPHVKFDDYIFKRTEAELLNRANFVFCSANNLKNTILQRSGIKRQCFIINNASSFPEIGATYTLNPRFNILKSTQSLLYIGTVSSWFDFDSIISLLEYKKDLHLYLVGPVDIIIPEHKRIHALGPCEHADIWGLMQSADILIMPFKIVPLIESVNPVKLYEYIWSQKPIIATRYKESEKFEDFVYLYSSIGNLIHIYDNIVANKFLAKNTNVQFIRNFISQNTWNERAKRIFKILSYEFVSE